LKQVAETTLGVIVLIGHQAAAIQNFRCFVFWFFMCRVFCWATEVVLARYSGFFDALMDRAKSFFHCAGLLFFRSPGLLKPDCVYGDVSTWRHDDFNGSFHCMLF